MNNVVRFPIGRRVLARPIPREEFEQLAELALDVVQQIVAMLDEEDGDADSEDSEDTEASLGAPEGHASQLPWLRGCDTDGELDSEAERQ